MKILVVDDHPPIRAGLKVLLSPLDRALKLDEASTCAEALAKASANSYHLMLLDLKLPGCNGLDALDAIRKATPELPIVIYSGVEERRTIRATIERGAMGFIPKDLEQPELIQAMRKILAHETFLPRKELDGVPGHVVLDDLTPRQVEILRCVIQGKPNKVIARELGISDGTVKQHVSAVLRGLNADNRVEAVYIAAKLGFPLA